jgi:hypothetical protein
MKLSKLAILLALPVALSAQSIRTNPGFNSKSIPRNDDGSSGLEPLGFTINFFGKLRSAAFVNNNGNLTFDSALPTFTPFGLVKTAREIIAPFFGDVDTRPEGSKLVTYGMDTVNGHRAFGANYVNVGYYNVHVDKLNSFQVVLIEREDTGAGNFDVEFNYATIRWETGDASGGVGGFGGTPAAVGWSNGTDDPGASFELPGSRLSGQFLDNGPRALIRLALNGVVKTSTSGGTNGRLVFRARDGVISPGLQISNALQLPEATLGASYNASLLATGAKAPFRWTVLPDVASPPGLTFGANGQITGVPTVAGTYSFTASVTATTEDGEATAFQRGSLTIRPAEVTILTGCPLADATVGRPYSLSLRASGGSSFTWSADPYSLPPGVSLGTNGQLAGTPLVPGTYVMALSARSNGAGQASAKTSCRLNVIPATVGLASGCSLRATVSVPYAQTLTPEGGYGPYRFGLIGHLPLGLAMTENGAIAGIPEVDGSYPFTVQVTDSRGVESVQNCNLSVTAPAFNLSSACPLPAATTGAVYSTQLPGGYTYSLAGGSLPVGLSLSPSGTITGTPMSAGPARFNLLATDGAQQQVGQACTLAVNRGPLSISGCPLPEAGVGEPYLATISALGGTAPYFFTAQGMLPDGLELSTDGVLRGATAASGSYSFSVLVREGGGQTTVQACTLSVARPALRLSNTCPLPEAQLGESYAARIEAAGGLAPYRFEFSGFLPDGLTGATDGSIRGTAKTLGGRTFVTSVTDSRGQSVTGLCGVNVSLPQVPEMVMSDLPATVAPAASNLAVSIQLTRAYTQPIDGTVTMTVQADARSSEAEANQADPRLRFSNGQLTVNFTLAPGQTRATFPIASTGTVASTVSVAVTSLKAAGAGLPLLPDGRSFRILPSAPVVTSSCYRKTNTGIEIELNGLSTTRELARADVGAAGKVFINDISSFASAYYTAPETVRAGGTFSIRLPYTLELKPDQQIGEVTVNLYNTVGATQVPRIAVCQ